MPTLDQARNSPGQYRRAAAFSLFFLATCWWAAMALGADCSLTPASVAKPRAEIALADSSLRVFNQRGCVSPRDWTVCGIKLLRFPPINLVDYCFGLAFRERSTGTRILDNWTAQLSSSRAANRIWVKPG